MECEMQESDGLKRRKLAAMALGLESPDDVDRLRARVAELEAELAGVKLAWTSEPPRVVGWYLKKQPRLAAWYPIRVTDDQLADVRGNFVDGLWLGPIPEPPAGGGGS